jgi:hypothetical protein
MHTTVGSKSMRWTAALAAILLAAAGLPGCTSVQRNSQSPSYLVVDAIQAAPGETPSSFAGFLHSDVHATGGGVFADPGQVLLLLRMVDPGGPNSPTVPTVVNAITVTRYHVRYTRSDGKNVQGVDVPFEFDAASTVTVGVAGATLPITLVRANAKQVAPLAALVGTANLITAQAEVTMFGADQAGNPVQAVAFITIDFADWNQQ